MTPHLKARDYTQALTHAIGRSGGLLAERFPPEDSRNELCDTVVRE